MPLFRLLILTIVWRLSASKKYLCDPNAQCGCSMEPVSTARIINGEDAVNGSWGWVVSLAMQNYTSLCGGSILSSSWILTTAHCVKNVSKSTMRVFAGSNLLWDGSQGRTVSRIFIHPEFDYSTAEHDIALLQLLIPLNMHDPALATICVPSVDAGTLSSGEWPAANTTVVAVGWGVLAEQETPSVTLQQVTLQTIDYRAATCRTTIEDRSHQLCAGAPNGEKDACTGDSGGPLVMFTPEKQWTLVGLTSFGKGCAQKDYAGIYTRVAAYEDWIAQTTGGSYSKRQTFSPSSNARTISFDSLLLVFILSVLF